MKYKMKNPKFDFLTENAKKIFAFLSSQPPEKADAIVWLQGDRYDRGNKVLELFKKGFAPKILVSGNNVRVGKLGEIDAFHDARLDEIKNFFPRPKKGIIIFLKHGKSFGERFVYKTELKQQRHRQRYGNRIDQ